MVDVKSVITEAILEFNQQVTEASVDQFKFEVKQLVARMSANNEKILELEEENKRIREAIAAASLKIPKPVSLEG